MRFQIDAAFGAKLLTRAIAYFFIGKISLLRISTVRIQLSNMQQYLAKKLINAAQKRPTPGCLCVHHHLLPELPRSVRQQHRKIAAMGAASVLLALRNDGYA